MGRSKRAIRLGDQLFREIAVVVLEKVKDPRVEGITVTGVRLSNDLRQAKVFYSLIGEAGQIEEAQSGLDRAKGYIKRQIGLRLPLRYVPELTFFYDGSLEYGSYMDDILDKLNPDGSNDPVD